MMSSHSGKEMKFKITINLPEDLHKKINSMKDELDITQAEVIRRAIGYYFQAAALEDLFFVAYNMTHEKIGELNQKMDQVLAKSGK